MISVGFGVERFVAGVVGITLAAGGSGGWCVGGERRVKVLGLERGERATDIASSGRLLWRRQRFESSPCLYLCGRVGTSGAVDCRKDFCVVCIGERTVEVVTRAVFKHFTFGVRERVVKSWAGVAELM